MSTIPARISELVDSIYPDAERRSLALEELQIVLERYGNNAPERDERWSQGDAFLITYGDSLIDGKKAPLQVLHEILRRELGDLLSFVHLLPCFPFTSDDGFSVVDFREINPDLGTWDDVEPIAKDYRLVLDAVVNHVSQESAYVQEYLKGNPDYADFVCDVPPGTDLSQVVRPRTSPLTFEFEGHDGIKNLWCTFSKDQVDLNVANPRVLAEIIDVLCFYAEKGSQMVRLDAIPFLWKEIGTSCSHLAQTHAIVQLARAVYDYCYPDSILLTETNVPHQENIAYFGNPPGSEAQMIYNFSLAPLTLYALASGDASALSGWAEQVKKPSEDASYLNITATHDGIGMRPTEGILSEEQRQELCAIAHNHGGTVSYKTGTDGSKIPYELNITYFDAISDPNADYDDATRVARFMAAQCIALSFIGVPGIYVHSLFGSRNDVDGWKSSDIPRRINRAKIHRDELDTALADDSSIRSQVLSSYRERLRIRQEQIAFHPKAEQEIAQIDKRCFAALRTHPEQNLIALVNVSGEEYTLDVSNVFSVSAETGKDVLADEDVSLSAVALAPYQVRWVSLL